MPVQIGWYVPEQVGYMRAYGRLEAQELYDAIERINEWYTASSAEKLHTLVDASDAETIPSVGVFLGIQVHPKNHWTIVFGRNRVANFVGSVVMHTLRKNIRTAPDLAEAVATLKRLDIVMADELDAGQVTVREEFSHAEHHVL